jgi:uncharacterized protein
MTEAIGLERAASSGRWSVGSTQRLLWALGLVVLQSVTAFIVGFGVVGPLVMGPDATVGVGTAAEFAALAIIVALEVGLVVVFGLLVVGKLSLRELGWRSERPGAHIALGLAGGVVCTGIVFALSAALGASPSEVGRTIADYTAAQRLLFVLIGLQAAFVEESLFRGYLQPTLVEKLGPMFGVVVGALVFAVYHLSFAPLPLAGKVLLGLVFGLLSYRTRSLYPGAIAHAMLWMVAGMV